jgi:glutathione synthase
MKLGLVVNDIHTELDDYTTTLIALEATNLGHEVWYISLADFAYDPDENVHARARSVPKRRYRSRSVYLEELRGSSATVERIAVDSLDVLLLRNDPAQDVVERPWARLAGINFGRLARRHGVIVLNDPNGLAKAVNKMYLQYFPVEIRPRTLISRHPEDIRNFINEEGGTAVLKPLSGSGGHNVFLIQPQDKANINQIIEAICQEGYVLAQEFLPEALRGDTRIFLMNGYPLQHRGHYAVLHRARVQEDGDFRSNITAGAMASKGRVTDDVLHIIETVRPKLVQDGMFFIGLDIVGDKLMEINVFSPGGLESTQQLVGQNFVSELVQALEHKVESLHRYHRNLNNIELATL